MATKPTINKNSANNADLGTVEAVVELEVKTYDEMLKKAKEDNKNLKVVAVTKTGNPICMRQDQKGTPAYELYLLKGGELHSTLSGLFTRKEEITNAVNKYITLNNLK